LAKLGQLSLSRINPQFPTELGFPPGLPVELAMGLNTPRSICTGYGVTKDDFEALADNPIFKAQFNHYMEMRTEPDGMFRLQAVLMSTKALDEQYKMMIDKEAPWAIRLKASENIIEYANLLPKKVDAGVVPFSINIDFSGMRVQPATRDPRRTRTIDHAALTETE
jgi:hypothetical protein